MSLSYCAECLFLGIKPIEKYMEKGRYCILKESPNDIKELHDCSFESSMITEMEKTKNCPDKVLEEKV